ncbi:class I SAM-dependent methyltransferase [Caenimonas sedimenti]|uniref:Class I SAM-dependent methyltransferase n=1 Tax=Caenimonas sedimenti TaxID=2596921 RepID=A0A562ZJM9_9BURK|nr:class I SAM-dependent methyltransferase [Caenimonas sedimenti]TWO68528.1 class I SAM-dependent methyltransferase [Caenimonas sedimenti]
MTIDLSRRNYWDGAAASKVFTHPLDIALLARNVAPDALVVDYGCGQGRLCAELRNAGYDNVIGLDFSPAMIARAREAHPGIRFEVIGEAGPTLPDGTVDCVLLFAVLTCIPDDTSQRALSVQLHRLLKPDGILYLSDYPLQVDTRNADRYAKHAAAGEPFGVFMTEDGARVRHHTPEWLAGLFGAFERTESRKMEVVTMNGHRSDGFQWILKRPRP